MKIAYLILSHAHPEHVIRLITRLRPVGALFVVHIDQRADPRVFQELQQYATMYDDVLLAARHRCYWGNYSLMEAEFECVRLALSSSRDFDYAMLISGQDYPIKDAAATTAFLKEHPLAEFIEAFSLEEANRWSGMAGPFQATSRVMHRHLYFRSRHVHVPLRRKFYRGWVPYGGSQWWCLTRTALTWIDRYRRDHPEIERYFRSVFIPDEAMMQTMMANSPFCDRLAPDLHYLDWERPNPKSPRTLVDEDFGRVMESSKLMARKLDPVASRVLLRRIDDEILGTTATE